MPSLCNLLLQQYSFLYIQTSHNDCSHIEDVHLLYRAHFIIFFSFLTGVEHRHFSPSEMLSGCLVCVICNFNSIHSIIFKLCIMIVHTLKMCTFYIVRLFHCFFSFLMGVEPRYFPICPSIRNILGVTSLYNLYLQKFSFLLIQTLPYDCSHIEDVHLLYCACFINFISFLIDFFSI